MQGGERHGPEQKLTLDGPKIFRPVCLEREKCFKKKKETVAAVQAKMKLA